MWARLWQRTRAPARGPALLCRAPPHTQQLGFHPTNWSSVQCMAESCLQPGWGKDGVKEGLGTSWGVPPAPLGLSGCPGWHCLALAAFAAPLKNNSLGENSCCWQKKPEAQQGDGPPHLITPAHPAARVFLHRKSLSQLTCIFFIF